MTEARLAYRPNEAARAIGASPDTIFRLLRRGELVGFKVGAARFISAEESARFIASREAQS